MSPIPQITTRLEAVQLLERTLPELEGETKAAVLGLWRCLSAEANESHARLEEAQDQLEELKGFAEALMAPPPGNHSLSLTTTPNPIQIQTQH